MKKYLIMALAIIVAYGATNWLFPFSPVLFNSQITYQSTEQDVEAYIQIHKTLAILQSTSTNQHYEIQTIAYGISQLWAMEKGPIKINIKDLFAIEQQLQQSKEYINYASA